MAHPAGETRGGVLRLDFDRRLKLEFHGSKVTSDAGLLPYRELDDALGLTEIAGDVLTDTRRGKNARHGLAGQFRQSVFGRLGGYDDVNDADRLSLDPAMRWIVGGKAVERQAASSSQMGRFETEVLATEENLAALADLSGQWPAQASENGLAELPDKTVATVLPTTGIREHVPSNLAQSHRIIQFPVRQQPSVGSDLGAMELKLQAAVKIQPQNPCFPFTHRVSHINTPNPPITL